MFKFRSVAQFSPDGSVRQKERSTPAPSQPPNITIHRLVSELSTPNLSSTQDEATAVLIFPQVDKSTSYPPQPSVQFGLHASRGHRPNRQVRDVADFGQLKYQGQTRVDIGRVSDAQERHK